MFKYHLSVIFALANAFIFACPPSAHCQSTPFMTDDEIRMFINEISGDRSFEHVRWLSHLHRMSGSDAYFKAADYIMNAAREAGLEDVKFIEQPLPGPKYEVKSAELWMVEPVEVKLADVGDHATFLAENSHDADVTAEMVWIGDATPETLEKIDVAGKIVLTSNVPDYAVKTAVWGKDALGVVSFGAKYEKSPFDYPDQIQWLFLPLSIPEGKKGTFAFNISPRQGNALRRILETDDYHDILATGKRTKGGRIVVRAKVDTEFDYDQPKTGFVEGWIRGTKYHDQQIVLTAHIQEEQGSANDDNSGCGSMLEIARTFNKLIKEGKIPRPVRDIRFWWSDEIYSERRYFADYPEELKNIIAAINQDMVGAKQTIGRRTQHLIYAPFSRTSYLDTVLESIGNFVIRSNNAFAAAGWAGALPYPHSRPIYSKRGTRDNFNARLIPYVSFSDHIVFLGGPAGIPAIALTNWEDNLIHTSEDELSTVDPTQMARNAFIVGAISHVLSSADAENALLLAGETYALGIERLGKGYRVAVGKICNTDNPEAGWKDAVALVEHNIERELRALKSCRVFAGDDSDVSKAIIDFIALVKQEKTKMTEALKNVYHSVNGEDPRPVQLSAEEEAASRKVPANVTPLAKYYENRNKIFNLYQGNLHRHTFEEVLNFIDGKLSYYDIYWAVRSEALTVGEWYYGPVSLDDVTTMLDIGVEVGVFELVKK